MSVAMVCMVNHSAVNLLKIELESGEGFVSMMEGNDSSGAEVGEVATPSEADNNATSILVKELMRNNA